MRTLKTLLMLSTILILVLSGASCNSTPDNEILKTHAEHTGWDKGKPVHSITYEIAPTSGQAFYYGFKSGYLLWFALGFTLVGIAGLIGYMEYNDRPVFGKGSTKSAQTNSIVVAVALLLAFACFGGQIGWIRYNNNKAIPKDQYHYYMERDGNIKAVWDSIHVNNLMLGAAYNK